MTTTLNEQFTRVGDIELCYETFGEPGDPAVLLIMGLGTQMLAWHADFCRALAARGFFVIRYDNRDCGKSTSMKGRPVTLCELTTRRDARQIIEKFLWVSRPKFRVIRRLPREVILKGHARLSPYSGGLRPQKF